MGFIHVNGDLAPLKPGDVLIKKHMNEKNRYGAQLNGERYQVAKIRPLHLVVWSESGEEMTVRGTDAWMFRDIVRAQGPEEWGYDYKRTRKRLV